MSFVELQRVWVRYGGTSEGTLALQNTSLEIASGEFVAVVGPSGCGKSTLMKIVTGLWPATRGTVVVNGRTVDRPLSITGMAFQNPTLLPWRTALRNVMLPLEVAAPHASRFRKEFDRYEQKARDLLSLVGLKGFEDKFPWQLSGGMQQRVSICRALVHEPLLLMLDEPFGALDMFTREELWVVMQNLLLARCPTVLLVTHDLREAVFLADRVLVMSARPGQIIADRRIGFTRKRDLRITYEPEFTSIVHELRDHISSAREAA